MRFIVFRHAAYEGLGSIADWLAAHNHTWFYVNLYEKVKPPPAMALNYDGCILMGGPQSVNRSDLYPEIRETLRTAERYLKLNKPLLGICLGAQAIAKAAGAEIKPSVFEFGFLQVQTLPHRLTTSLPEKIDVFQWHGENFALPAGASQLFSGAAVENQGFILGKALALQFHLELNEGTYQAWQQVITARGETKLLENLPPQAEAYAKLSVQRENLFRLLDGWSQLFAN